MTRPLRPLAAFALVTLIAAGCSTVDSAGARQDTDREKAVAFATCMRDNGVREFPDPDASGRLTIDGIVNGSSVDTDSPAWKRAAQACKNLQPAGFTGNKRSAEQQSIALQFAQCIRENGVQDFPDPDPNGPLVDTNRIPSAAGKGGRDIPGLHTAMATCGKRYADQLGLGNP